MQETFCYIFILVFIFLSAAPAASNNVEMDLLGSMSESFSSSALALVPAAAVSEGDVNGNSGSAAGFTVAPSASNQVGMVCDFFYIYCKKLVKIVSLSLFET